MPDFSSVVPRLLEPNRNWILNVKGAGLDLRTAGLLTGDTGILLVQAIITGVDTAAAELGESRQSCLRIYVGFAGHDAGIPVAL